MIISTNSCIPPDIIKGVDFRRKAAMNAEELLVHESRQRKAVKGLHAGVIDPLRVFDFTFGLEGEILGKMATLMITT